MDKPAPSDPEMEALGQFLKETNNIVTRSGRVVKTPARFLGGSRCSAAFKLVLKSIFALLAAAIGYYTAVPVAGVAVNTIGGVIAAVNGYCAGGPMSYTGFQIGICGLITKLQTELISFFAAQNFSTLQAALTGAAVVGAATTFWGKFKALVSGSNSALDKLVDDFCDKYYPDKTFASSGTQTESVAVAEIAKAADQAAADPSIKGPMDKFLRKRGGRRGKRTAKKRLAKRSTRKLSFRY